MKTIVFAFFAVLLPLFFSGCSSLEIHTDWDQSADFSKLKTYAWTTATQPDTGNPEIDDDLFDERTRKAIDQTLASKGYQKLASGTPDFLVSYHIIIKDMTDVNSVPTIGYATPYGYGRGGGFSYWSYQTFTTHYQEGTLIIDIVNAQTKKLIWRSTGTDVVEPAKTPEKRDQEINDGIRHILAGFPPETAQPNAEPHT